jgi:hypothetical protein
MTIAGPESRRSGTSGRFVILLWFLYFCSLCFQWVAERYNQSTPENFWTEFYDHKRNQCMTFTAIDNELRKQRKRSDQRIVEQWGQHGTESSQLFQVRGKPMVRSSAMAKRIAKNHI